MSDPDEPKVFIVEKRCDEKGMRITNFDKILIAVIIGIIFFILASPLLFKLTNKGTSLIGLRTVKDNGNITTAGLILHTIVFIVAVYILMH